MWHSSDLISIRFPRPQINPFTSLHPPLVSACRNSPPRRKRNTFWITALWILAQFFFDLRKKKWEVFVQISSSMTVTFPSPHCWLSCDLYRPSKDAKKVAVLRQLLVPDPLSFRLYWPCQHRAPFFFTDGDNRGQSFCEGDLWQESGMWSPQRVSGPDLSILSFFKCFSTNTCPVWRLSEADVCSLAGSDVIFLFNYFEVRQVWRTNAAMKRKGD